MILRGYLDGEKSGLTACLPRLPTVILWSRISMNVDTGVYSITNVANGKRYIGSARSFVYRWKKHKCELRAGVHHCEPLQRAWIKYGEDSFVFEKIALCAITDLLAVEQDRIVSISPEYNVCRIAGSNIGVKRSAETLLKMSASQKGKPRSPEQRTQISATLKGRYAGSKNPAARKITCIETGEIFPCILDAVLWIRSLGKSKASLGGISSACSGKYKSAYGFRWSYLDDPAKELLEVGHKTGDKSPNAKRVVCIETGQEFGSCDSAARWLQSQGHLKAKGPAVGDSARGHHKTAYGFHWKYAA